MADGTLQVGVSGTGGMGGRHVRNLAHRVSGAELAAVGPTVRDGYAARRVAEAAEQSLATGRAEAVPDEPCPALYGKTGSG